MSLLRPTPGMPMWPLAMKGNEASRPESSATGMAMPVAGPRIASGRTSRKITEATSSTAQATTDVASFPGRRIATEQTRISVARPTAPSRKQACAAPQREQHRAPDQQGREQDYPCRDVGSGEGAQEGGQHMESVRKGS